MTRRQTFVLLAVLAVPVAGLFGWQHYTRSADATVCRILRELDGVRADPALIERIQRVGKKTHTHLGKITRHADGDTSPGHLFLTSEDYNHTVSRCADLGIPAPQVDPAAGPRARQ